MVMAAGPSAEHSMIRIPESGAAAAMRSSKRACVVRLRSLSEAYDRFATAGMVGTVVPTTVA